jgi:hypothetical protein
VDKSKTKPIAKSMRSVQRTYRRLQVDQFVAGSGIKSQRCRSTPVPPLHLLANKERASSIMWRFPSYSTRAESFTSIVRVILDGRFHEDQVNLDGKSALEYLNLSLSNIQMPNYPSC